MPRLSCSSDSPARRYVNSMSMQTSARGLRRAARSVALLNLGYFGLEFGGAVAIGSVSLFADSIDFLEDASVNLLIARTLGWSSRNRARLGMAPAGLLLVPAMVTFWTGGKNSMRRFLQSRCRCRRLALAPSLSI